MYLLHEDVRIDLLEDIRAQTANYQTGSPIVLDQGFTPLERNRLIDREQFEASQYLKKQKVRREQHVVRFKDEGIADQQKMIQHLKQELSALRAHKVTVYEDSQRAIEECERMDPVKEDENPDAKDEEDENARDDNRQAEDEKMEYEDTRGRESVEPQDGARTWNGETWDFQIQAK